jgi:hypothetical protein
MIDDYNVDLDRIIITGDSGGGHMTLLMAGKYPDLWSAAAAWCPVTDLREWWELQSGYAADVVAVTGGTPGRSPVIDFEYARRSPRTFMTNLAHLPVLLGHGDSDPIIPVAQSWRSFRALKTLPEHETLFYVFSGGHTGLQSFGLDWCAERSAPRQTPTELHLVTDESKSYYWTDLQMSDETRLARADVVLGDDALSVATENLASLALDLGGLTLPRSGMTLAVRNDHALTLRLRGAPEATRVDGAADWCRVGGSSGEALEMRIEPAVEARSVSLAW